MNEREIRDRLNRLQRAFLVLGVIGVVAAVIGLFVNTRRFFEAYLFGWMFWTMASLGGFALTMLINLVGGRWRAVVRRPYESAARTLGLVAVLAIPLFFGMDFIYPWSRPEVMAESHLIASKALYLNDTFFWIRTVSYFAIWLILLTVMLRWSQQQESDPTDYRALNLRRISAAGLVIFFFTMTFATVDWGMTLEPAWFSTMYGLILGLGGLVTAHALTLVVLSLLGRGEPTAGHLKEPTSNDLGSFMLAYVMLWTYVAFMQYLIIWSGDLLEEIPYYLERTSGGWGVLALAIVVFHFVVPFFLLLLRDVKGAIGRLALVAITILAARALDFAWTILPSYDRSGWGVHWLDVALFVAIGGLWLCVYFWQLAARPWVSRLDLRSQEAVAPMGEGLDA